MSKKKKRNNISDLYLQRILNSINYEDLPETWNSFDIISFSITKKLWDFQQRALKNIIKCLFLYFEVDKCDKEGFLTRYKEFGLNETLKENLKLPLTKALSKISKKYYPTKENKIAFYHFINRLACWMATGSGKSLIIIKLVEILHLLISSNSFEKQENGFERDILILTYREDLINQFKELVAEFNELSTIRGFKIRLENLKDYEEVKHNFRNLGSLSERVVFYYRSDLFSEEQKKKVINYKNYENGGNWYVILDEAHKGAKKESKLQLFYSILSRNGFLFNFSATFTDDEDKVTTAFNFNLKEFVSRGYGKHIYLSQQEITAFKDKDLYSKIEKQKVVLKSFVLLTYIKKMAQKFKVVGNGMYHKPILLTLVNSVNNKLTKNRDFTPDLLLFFREIEKIAKNEFDNEILELVKCELKKEFSKSNSSGFMFEKDIITLREDTINEITMKEILQYIFNSKSKGGIEVIQIKDNIHEALLKLKTTNTPFALIKIGNAVKWIKDNLRGYEITRTFEHKSVFDEIETRDEFSILMGSRAFYEGWDSNRPNIILYINIGVGENSKKFVLQSLGRGVRIEPIKEKRRRLNFLANGSEDAGFNNLVSINEIKPLETLFIFGTKKRNLREILHTLNVRKEFESFEMKIPQKNVDKSVITSEKIKIDDKILKMLKKYFYEIDDRIILMENNLDPKILHRIKESIANWDIYYELNNSNPTKPGLSILKREISRISYYFKQGQYFNKL